MSIDQLLDGATVPWDFISGRRDVPTAQPMPPQAVRAPLTPQQSNRRRLIAAGRWRRS